MHIHVYLCVYKYIKLVFKKLVSLPHVNLILKWWTRDMELQGLTGSMVSHGKAEPCQHSPPLM